MRLLLLWILLPFQILLGQKSTFDFGNEGWKADGDAQNGAAVWQSNGGIPGGHIRTVDGSTGGTWYFVAPNSFLGPKCDAYNGFLRYDQYTSNNTSANNNPDIQIRGGGITLVFDNPILPGINWTHYDVLLREDAGWRINTLTGNTPTQAQFKQVLSNVTSLRIRGEYLSLGVDYGGLDNVILESNLIFEFDLDGDDSSGATDGNYFAEASCTPQGPIVDSDLILTSVPLIDSIQIKILGGTIFEMLEWSQQSPFISIVQYTPGNITLFNTGSAIPADFAAMLQLIQYQDTSPNPTEGIRELDVKVFTNCGAVGAAHRTRLPILLPPFAGLPGDTVLCYGNGAIDLRSIVKGNPEYDGYWQPVLRSGTNFFDPNVDVKGAYQYIVPGVFPCRADTVVVAVDIDYPFQLTPDTTICYSKTLMVNVPSGLNNWVWSTGSAAQRLVVSEPGTYQLEGSTDHCTFYDSVKVDFYTCVECPPYAPNVFSPNDDGENDAWHIFLPCHWTDYLLEVYDRWGMLVFRAKDPEALWDGRIRGEDVAPGVYVWRMRWTGEIFGQPRSWDFKGDVTLLR